MGNLFQGNALLGLLAAGLWGVGDYSGGMGVKTAGGSVSAALRVLIFSHFTSFAVLLALALAIGDTFPHGRLLAWGLTAGFIAGISVAAFYFALARGGMGVSAAISGILAAAIPAIYETVSKSAPNGTKLLGFVVAALAIWLVAAGDFDENPSTRWLATAAGAGFGLYFIALQQAGTGGILWPMATVRMGSISTCTLILLLTQIARKTESNEASPDWLSFPKGTCFFLCRCLFSNSFITKQVILWILLTALFDTTGNLTFIAATRAGRLDVASVLASLYPATTILMAAWRNKERPTQRQLWGMATALVAVVLIAR